MPPGPKCSGAPPHPVISYGTPDRAPGGTKGTESVAMMMHLPLPCSAMHTLTKNLMICGTLAMTHQGARRARSRWR